jgi:hypothetical protein
MPLTDLQARILRVLATGRSPESYLAGATVLHRSDDSPRFSQDLDFFHDVADSVAQCAEADATTLLAAGIDFEWILRTPTFFRAVVSVGGERLKLEWAQDSVFRFFPVQADEFCGYRLHDADAAVNKILALAGREEVRDFVDILHLHRTYLAVGTLAWAACGKDPGYSPAFLLDHAGRHVRYSQDDLDRLQLREPLGVADLKRQWLTAVEQAQALIELLPESDLGCLYLTSEGVAVTPDPAGSGFRDLGRHFGSVRGAWPSIAPYRDDSSPG